MTYAGTPLYMAPEQLRETWYDHRIDVWAYACCLEVLITHKKLYEAWGSEDQSKVRSLLSQVHHGTMGPSTPPGHFLEPIIARSVAEGRTLASMAEEEL